MLQLQHAGHKEKIVINNTNYVVFYFASRHYDSRIKVMGNSAIEAFVITNKFFGENKIQCADRAIYECVSFPNILVVLSPEYVHFDIITGRSPAVDCKYSPK